MFYRLALALVMVGGVATAARADAIVIVPGTSDPWLAGMPAGSTASSGDVAPGQSPVDVLGLAFGEGSLLTFSSVGSTDHCFLGACGLAGAEGDPIEDVHTHSAENGIGGVIAPIDALMGVFLGAAESSLFAAPGMLDFQTLASRDFATLSPLLQQTFFIGDGRRGDATTVQTFAVPAGATRLFLGTMDGWGWFNNVGSLTVTVGMIEEQQRLSTVPEPVSLGLFGLGLGMAALRVCRQRARSHSLPRSQARPRFTADRA